jgi:acyl-coenzyme A synthetase/AMP-(fatty) acid ligase
MQTETSDFSNINIVDCLRRFSKSQPDHPAMEDGERSISYRQLDIRTDEAAVNIRAAGISAGDIVTVILEDSIEHLIVICGLARAGAIIFSLNSALATKEIRESMAEIGSETVVTSAGTYAFQDLVNVFMENICAANGESFGEPGACGDQPYLLIQSSGTTGKPKSFYLNHSDSWRNYRSSYEMLQCCQSDRFVSLPRMCFHFSRNFFLRMLNNGATIVLARDLSAKGLCDLINNHQISYFSLVPSHLMALLDYAKSKTMLFPNLRVLTSAGAPLTPQTRLLARKRLNPNFLDGYGSNEMGAITFSSPQDQDLHPESVGRPTADVDVQIVDMKDQVLPRGEAGLIRIRGVNMPKGYIDNPEMSARHFRSGWFYPGDVAKINDEGYLFFLGRADDIINNAGIKFYPVEVEKVLLNHPDVVEGAVFPWPHNVAGQVAAAAVVSNGNVTSEQLREYCAERLAGYKVPRVIAFRTFLPKNAMGKVLKRKLAVQMQAEARAQLAKSN